MENIKIVSFPKFWELYKDRLGVGQHTARKMVRQKDFPKIMVGSQPRIIIDRVDDWIDQQVGTSFE